MGVSSRGHKGMLGSGQDIHKAAYHSDMRGWAAQKNLGTHTMPAPHEATLSSACTKPVMLIGCGHMGQALATGWLKAGLNPADFFIVDRNRGQEGDAQAAAMQGVMCVSSLEALMGPLLASGRSDFVLGANPAAAGQMMAWRGYIVLAVKPAVCADVLKNLSEKMDLSEAVVVSVAAGVSGHNLKLAMGGTIGDTASGPAIVRAMPNVPVSVGAGVTGLWRYNPLSAVDAAAVEALFTAVGLAPWVAEEKQIDAITALSGSGPAYIFHMAEAMAAAAESLGLDAAIASAMARQTIVGAALMMQGAPDVSAASLRQSVTSPKGTTQAALERLMAEDGLPVLMRQTLAQAYKRARELANGGN